HARQSGRRVRFMSRRFYGPVGPVAPRGPVGPVAPAAPVGPTGANHVGVLPLYPSQLATLCWEFQIIVPTAQPIVIASAAVGRSGSVNTRRVSTAGAVLGISRKLPSPRSSIITFFSAIVVFSFGRRVYLGAVTSIKRSPGPRWARTPRRSGSARC